MNDSHSSPPAKPKRDTKKHGRRLTQAQKLALVAEFDQRSETVEVIAKRNGVAPSTLYNVKKALISDPSSAKQLEAVEKGLAANYLNLAARASDAISDEKLGQSSAYQLVGMSALAVQTSRLLREKSTSNIALRGAIETTTETLTDLTKQIADLGKESANSDPSPDTPSQP